MQVPGNTLPVLSGFLDYSAQQQNIERRSQSRPDLAAENEPRDRQQTVEYVFQGDLEDEVDFPGSAQNTYSQAIDPANREAISAYNAIDASNASRAPRQGGLVNLFV